MAERLQKLLAQRGIASRRQSEKLILAGRVTVNGKVAEIGQQADVNCDRICVDGVEIGKPPRCVYLLLHKPKGFISTCKDPQARKTVLDLLDDSLRSGMGIHPVGRLDVDSTGALLLTNDGELTYKLTHPSHQMPKTYRVRVQGVPTEATLKKWRSGLLLDGRKTLPAGITLIVQPVANQTLLKVRLTEGRNRQIRRVAEALGHPVTALHRIEIGSLTLGSLPRGRYRLLKDEEVNRLKNDAAFTKTSPSKVSPPITIHY